MSDQGEKLCPLCTEEMDLTDQQLKPCKCGYEVCVWCWHHIIEMAEKDETVARCPACRTPYNKEKIVGTAANCDRVVTGISVEKKKPQKAKAKTSEGRKQLSNVRVIRRNLVYIVGLPLNLADEDLLLHKEYFGKYGKVLKVSVSRTSSGAIQQFPNNTCNVYITYAKEEEAIRCIQSIHGFTLEGRSLRACFGTTKYCHAWLRNAPCTVPDCLYLHEIGSQVDSFTKDEIVSAYSRVQQITGITNNVQTRSGNVLPPPLDEYTPINIAKPAVKSTLNNLGNTAKVSPPTSIAGKNCALPAAASWGSRASSGQSSTGGFVCSNATTKQKSDAAGTPLTPSATVESTLQTSSECNDLGINAMSDVDSRSKKFENKPRQPENTKQPAKDLQTNMSVNSHTPSVIHAAPNEPSSSASLDNIKSRHSAQDKSNTVPESVMEFSVEEENHMACPAVVPISIDKPLTSQNSEVALVPRDKGLQHFDDAKLQPSSVGGDATTTESANTSRPDIQSSAMHSLSSAKENEYDFQGASDSTALQASLQDPAHPFDLLNYLRNPPQQHGDPAVVMDRNNNPVVYTHMEEQFTTHPSAASNGLKDDQLQCTSGISNPMVTSDSVAASMDFKSGMDVIENSIISNILDLDLDPWDDASTSPQDLAKLLCENKRRQGSFSLSSSLKPQNSNQSKFSFARQEESQSQMFDAVPSTNMDTVNLYSYSSQPPPAYREPYTNSLGNGFGVPHRNAEQYNGFGNSQSVFPSTKHSVSRAQISAPPGFSGPTKSPPPGFSLHSRSDQTTDTKSGNYFLETTSRDPYLASSSSGTNNVMDIEFIDPAILAVGKGMPSSNASNSNFDSRPAFSSQSAALESDNARLQYLLQRSFQPLHQNLRYANNGNSNSYSPNEAHAFNSRHLESSQTGHLSLSQFGHQSKSAMSNCLWDKQPEAMPGSNIRMTGTYQNDPLSFNKLYGGYGDSRFQMPSSVDIYNGAFGM